MMKKFMTYEEAKAYMKGKCISTKKEYEIWWLANREENLKIGLPQYPDTHFKERK